MALKTIKNRCDTTFIGMYDGQLYELKPQQEMTLTAYMAHHLKTQSVYSDNPVTGERKFRLGIVEDGDDLSPLKSSNLPQDSLDRTDMDMPKVEYRSSGARPAVPESKGSGRFDSITMTGNV